MPYRNFAMITEMREMIQFFEPYCDDSSTLRELNAHTVDQEQWGKCHSLFQKIRTKKLATAAADEKLQAQYSFEEMCAKALYNLSQSGAPFDPDSGFWVLPLGIELAIKLGIPKPTDICSITRPLG